MKVSEAMTRDVHVVNPNETVQNAARLMANLDAGVLPVGENDRLIGMITDRDIAVRGLAPINNIDAGGVQRADGHGIRVRRTH